MTTALFNLLAFNFDVNIGSSSLYTLILQSRSVWQIQMKQIILATPQKNPILSF